MLISLYHRDDAKGNPPGIYYCDIRNRTTDIILQEIYVGIYPNKQGGLVYIFIFKIANSINIFI